MASNPFNFDDDINPLTGQPYSDSAKNMFSFQSQPGAANPEAPVSPMTPESTQPMNPQVRDYLMQKFNLGDYSDDKRKQLQDASKIGLGDKAGAALAAIGAGFMGKDAASAGQAHLNAAKSEKRQALDDFEKGRKQKIEEYSLGRQALSDERTDKTYQESEALKAKERDPNSEESKMAQDLAKRMGYKGDPSTITAEQFKQFSPSLSKIYDIEQKKLDRAEARDERRFQQGIKMDEKMQGLKTPYGLANTVDDAKQLKEAHESKQAFDSKIQEMIDLRKKYGGEAFNREAVARGKQLSKDLLLEYKNMAKLGVLSKSDEDIINAIIPADPLEFSAASLVGQDPILHKLEKFKEDSDRDFSTRVQTRTRDGGASAANTLKGAQKPETKVINGKTYRKVDGGWEEVE